MPVLLLHHGAVLLKMVNQELIGDLLLVLAETLAQGIAPDPGLIAELLLLAPEKTQQLIDAG